MAWKHILIGTLVPGNDVRYIDDAQGLALEVGVPFFEASAPEYDNWTVVVLNDNRLLAWDSVQDEVPFPWHEQRDSLCIDLGQWRGMNHALSLLTNHYA